MKLLPMDYALLRHLVEVGGWDHTRSIPSKIFNHEIPDDAPNLIESGVIEHVGENTRITPAGRLALTSQERQA